MLEEISQEEEIFSVKMPVPTPRTTQFANDDDEEDNKIIENIVDEHNDDDIPEDWKDDGEIIPIKRWHVAHIQQFQIVNKPLILLKYSNKLLHVQ